MLKPGANPGLAVVVDMPLEALALRVMLASGYKNLQLLFSDLGALREFRPHLCVAVGPDFYLVFRIVPQETGETFSTLFIDLLRFVQD